MNSSVVKWTSLIGLYVIIFLMLVEWLIPVVQLTSTGHLGLFLIFIILCLGSNIVNLNGVVSFTIKIAYILWFLMYVYMETNFFSADSMVKIADDFGVSVQALIAGDWNGVADTFRSILFFVLLWMTIYLIHHWLTVKHTVVYFFLTTIVFLGLIDTLTKYNANYAIMRVMFLGILLMGVLFVNRLFKNSQVKLQAKHYIMILIPLVIMIMGSFLFAFLMPKKQAMVNTPQSIVKVMDWKNGQNGIGKIGYVEDDSKLGGPFEEDNRPVFEATAKENQYWRIETKDIYTGKGWVRGPGDIYVHTFEYGEDIPMTLKPGKGKNTDVATINLKKDYKFIMQPYGLKSIDQPNDEKSFYIEIESEKIRPSINEQKVLLKHYSMSYSTPEYSLKELEKTKMSDLKNLSKDYDQYLQLPISLPERVNKLAEDITKDEKNVYDKANAIVSYFQFNGYQYSRSDVAVPKEDQDYVDQFLFETKLGYCDNFSTSMVVMLRTLGIPARWVKGFSEGDEVTSNDDTRHFVVTNNNAHSWVEAYIPGVGWMSFEPTIGFDGFDNVLNDIKDEQNEGTINPKQKENDKAKEEKKKKAEQKKQAQQQKEQAKKEEKKKQQQEKVQGQTNIKAPNNQWLKVVSILAVIIILIAILLYMTRKKWMPKWLLMKYRFKGKENIQIDRLYNDLLKQLSLNGMSKTDGQTLRDFAKQVDEKLGSEQMSVLTGIYEEYLYSNEASTVDKEKMIECWKYLINRITS